VRKSAGYEYREDGQDCRCFNIDRPPPEYVGHDPADGAGEDAQQHSGGNGADGASAPIGPGEVAGQRHQQLSGDGRDADQGQGDQQDGEARRQSAAGQRRRAQIMSSGMMSLRLMVLRSGTMRNTPTA
jgi:hypothetical protein